jgi:hypothetical protein
VNGVLYESLDEVPDEADREKLTAMVDGSVDQQFEQHFKDFDKDLAKAAEEAKRGAASMEKIVIGAFTGVAVLMLLIAAISSYRAVARMSREESATGRVVEIIERREYLNEQDRIVQDYYYPVVEYASADGRPHTVHMTEGSSFPSHEVGDKVTVLYDPEHPLDARIKSFSSDALMWILPGITAILGLGFLGAVLIVRNVMKPTESNELA